MIAAAVGCDARAQQRETARTEPLPACEWCGAAEAPRDLTFEARLAPPGEPGTAFVLSGVVYRPDRRTPAANVLVYVYHTNQGGVYPKRGSETGNARRHGYLRGWLRTDSAGRYRVVTIRPGGYPTRDEPAHIHMTVTPPGGDERYIPSTLFADDPRLSADDRARLARGEAPYVVRTTRDDAGVLRATRDIVLETWPAESATGTASGVTSNGAAAKPASTRELPVDVAASVVRWKGTKFGGRGKHEGVVRIASGTVTLCEARVCGGQFTIDMRSIEVTDIPAHEPVPRARLTEHLNSRDFFWTERYPSAAFRLIDARPMGAAGYRVSGDLTIREVTKRIEFPATAGACTDALSAAPAARTRTCIDARFELDRDEWGITYRFDPIRNLLVDDTMSFHLTLVLTGTLAA